MLTPFAERIKLIILEELLSFVPGSEIEGALYSSRFWRWVFVRVFGEEPKDNKDPRWDALLHKKGDMPGGLTILSEYLEQERRKLRAA